MALQKQPISLNFAQGIDTKSDPFQVQLGSFQQLHNSVFSATGRLTKRNGFNNLTTLPNRNQTTLTTLNDNPTATGSNLYAFSADTDQWLNKGTIQPVNLDVQSLVRSSTSQVSPDAAVTSNGLTCLAYMDTSLSYYQISDSNTGQQIIARTALPATAVNPRVFILTQYFIITFVATVAATPTLQYIAIPIANPTSPMSAATISASMDSLDAGYDAVSVNNTLYIAWYGAGNTVKIAFLNRSLVVSSVTTLAASDADLMSVTADTISRRIFISYWDSGTEDGFSAAFDYQLNQVMDITQIIDSTEILEITSIASNGILTVFFETVNVYGFSGGASSDFVSKLTVTLPATVTTGTVSSATVILRSVGLASKPFVSDVGVIYLMVAYGNMDQSPATDNSNQPTYFLIDSIGNIYMKLAYSNGGGYARSQVLPAVSIIDNSYYFPYLITDFLTTVNKGTSLPSGTPLNAIYTQTGINLGIFTIDDSVQYSSEIANALHLTGGQLWEYDGVKPVEHNFHLWPENIVVTTSASGGSISDQTYNYVFTYEWTDNQGMLHRSAPSIPTTIITAGGNTSTNTIYVPTLRLTYKLSPNPVRIVGYRWSTAQQTYYQFTSITSPVVNSTTADYVTINDTLADASILGQTLLYTTGGVLENIAAPASIHSALFDNRLWIIDAEDPNLLWYSKQVIQNVPVEMSDLLTLFVAPTSGSQGSTGPMTAVSAMDDKLIIFKRDAIYYINGSGPDNTGANSSYSNPVFVTSTVGCIDPNSIVLIPNGLMFQSDKGIWLLARDLSTNYIGAPVEVYSSQTVKSSKAIPGTNQVRFILDNSITLMYDYYYNQWGTHSNISAISSTIYQGMHTYLNSYGQVYQEQADRYTDGPTPVLISFITSWINIAGLQGYERFYFAFLLGTYFSPFKLIANLAYNYNSSATQSIEVIPDNFAENWGDESLWGSGPAWGGPGNVFSARLFPEKQKCESFQLSIQEQYDASLGQAPGQGLSLSGLNMIVGVKKGYRTQSARKSFG